MPRTLRSRANRAGRGLLLALAVTLTSSVHAFAQGPALAGYDDHDAFLAEARALTAIEGVSIETIGTTREGRALVALTLSVGPPADKPALAIVGNVHAPHLAGAELAMGVVRALAEGLRAGDPRVRAALERVSVYAIPRPSPDATARFFERPYLESALNTRPTDLDKDGEVDEDPPTDLDGDGWITSVRVRDPRGRWLPHPDDPRVLIEADPHKGERGVYRLHVEGRDLDHDGQLGEDLRGGVDLNKNFPFRYPFFAPGAGPYQVSEPESKALADFLFARPNVACVYVFTPEDNLFHPWKPDKGAEKNRKKTHVLEADAAYLDPLAERYRELHGGKDAPKPPVGAGSFSEWSYFHYGRFVFAARGTWIPKVDAKAAAEAEESEGKDKKEEAPAADAPPSSATPTSTEAAKGASEKAKPDPRGEELRNALAYFDREGIDGFVPWASLSHPDLPDEEVEVGGVKPFYLLNPPAAALAPLQAAHANFALELLESAPRLRLEVRALPLGAGVVRIEATVFNDGRLPTMAAMGEESRWVQPVQVELSLPDGARLLEGVARRRVPRLAGAGGHAEVVWLALVPMGAGEERSDPPALDVEAWSPVTGRARERARWPEPTLR